MSRSLGDDAEYPYLPRNPANLVAEDRLLSSYVARRRFLSLWFWRFVLGCAAIAGVVFIAVGLVAYSVSVQ